MFISLPPSGNTYHLTHTSEVQPKGTRLFITAPNSYPRVPWVTSFVRPKETTVMLVICRESDFFVVVPCRV